MVDQNSYHYPMFWVNIKETFNFHTKCYINYEKQKDFKSFNFTITEKSIEK